MKRIKVDTAPPAVKQFLRKLPIAPTGVQLELAGKVIAQITAPTELSTTEKAAIVARGRELVKRARERNKDVSARVLEKGVRDAVRAVRGRLPTPTQFLATLP